MTRLFARIFCAMALLLLFAAPAAAEITLPVNDPNTGVFDQPSVVLNGPLAHLAFIGDNTASGVFRVFYAAVNAGADFTNLALSRNQILATPPTEVNDPAGDPYFDARHPKIAVRTASEVVILFQARPTPADNVYRLYSARVSLLDGAVSGQSVLQVRGATFTAGDIEDVAFALVGTDNAATVRAAYANRSAIGAADDFRVFFARILLDNASVIGDPLLLSTVPGSEGSRPIPALRLDGSNRAHVAWAAADNSIRYALVKDLGTGLDNLAIGATPILGEGRRWAHPNILFTSAGVLTVVAADETRPGEAGGLGYVQLAPDAVVQNGQPVVVGTDRTFLILGPNFPPSSTFDLFRPEAFIDAGDRIFLTGYSANGTLPSFYAIKLNAAFPFADFQTGRSTVGRGSNEPPGEIAGDYTKAAFAFVGGKVIVFWSGRVGTSANRNLDVTTVGTVPAFVTTEESGCSMVRNPVAGEPGRIPGAAVLFLPAAVLAIRRLRNRLRAK